MIKLDRRQLLIGLCIMSTATFSALGADRLPLVSIIVNESLNGPATHGLASLTSALANQHTAYEESRLPRSCPR